MHSDTPTAWPSPRRSCTEGETRKPSVGRPGRFRTRHGHLTGCRGRGESHAPSHSASHRGAAAAMRFHVREAQVPQAPRKGSSLYLTASHLPGAIAICMQLVRRSYTETDRDADACPDLSVRPTSQDTTLAKQRAVPTHPSSVSWGKIPGARPGEIPLNALASSPALLQGCARSLEGPACHPARPPPGAHRRDPCRGAGIERVAASKWNPETCQREQDATSA